MQVRRRSRRGGSLSSLLTKGVSAAKKAAELSKKYGVADLIASAGHPKAAALLKAVGAGRRRRHRRRHH